MIFLSAALDAVVITLMLTFTYIWTQTSRTRRSRVSGAVALLPMWYFLIRYLSARSL